MLFFYFQIKFGEFISLSDKVKVKEMDLLHRKDVVTKCNILRHTDVEKLIVKKDVMYKIHYVHDCRNGGCCVMLLGNENALTKKFKHNENHHFFLLNKFRHGFDLKL